MITAGEPPKIFTRFLVSYLLVLSVPILSGIYIHRHTLSMLEQDTIRSNQSFLIKTVEIIDRPLQEIDRMLSSLAFDQSVNTFLNMGPLSDGSPEIAKVREVWEDLDSIVITSSLIRDIMIAGFNSNIVVSQKIPFAQGEIFYGTLFEFVGMPPDAWETMISSRYHHRSYLPAIRVRLVTQTFTAIPRLQLVPLDLPRAATGLIAVLIDGSEIETLLSSLNLGPRGSVYIVDGEGNLILSIPSESNVVLHDELTVQTGSTYREVDSERLLVTHTTSPFNEWTYVSSVYVDDIAKRLFFIRRLLMSILIGGAVIGGIVALLMAYRNSKPILELIDLLRGERLTKDSKPNGTYNLLRSGIIELISENEELSTALLEQRPIVQSNLIRKLLEGHFAKDADIRAFAKHANLELSGTWYAVAEARINAVGSFLSGRILDELAIARMHVKQAFEGRIPARFFFHEEVPSVLTSVLIFGKTDERQCKETLVTGMNRAITDLSNSYNLPVAVGLSTMHPDLRSVAIAYEEAQVALSRNSDDRADPVLEYASSHKDGNAVAYTFEAERRLVHYVTLGKRNEAVNLLRRVFKQNISNPEEATRARLMHSLFHTAARIATEHDIEYPLSEAARKAQNEPQEKDSERTVIETFIAICEKIAAARDARENKLKHQITDFIEQSCADSMLNLYSVASRFNYTESYLYHFFAEQVGMSFTSFLEKTRMEKAAGILRDPGISIDDVAGACGYNSGHSFRRAFKRVTGMTPSDYRSLINQTA